MEVAGLVLGGIPLAIHALQEYRSFLSSFRHAQRHLDSIIRHLQAQQNILANTCNVLLTGIATPSEIGAMIQEPFSPSWNKHEGKVKLRLGEDFQIFQDTSREMQNTVKSLQRNLAIGDDGKVSKTIYNPVLSHVPQIDCKFGFGFEEAKVSGFLVNFNSGSQPALRDDASFILALKKGVRFTLRRKDYDSLIAALNEGNATLLTLVSQSKQLEPFRESRARHSYIRTVQRLTRGVYTSLCASVNCKCTGVHELALELDVQKAGSMNIDNDGHVGKSTFSIAFGSNRAKSTERWEQLHASMTSISSDPPSVPLMPQGFHFTYSSGSAGSSSGNAILASTSRQLPSTTSTMASQGTTFARPRVPQASAQVHVSQIEDLCSVFAGKKRNLAGGCFGFITDNTSQFFLSHKNCNSPAYAVVTLRDIISGGDQRFPELDYSQKVRVAYTLSSNLLPLVTTPWLEKVLSIEDIAFLSEGYLGAHIYHLDRPFLTKDLAISPSTPEVSCGHRPSGSVPPRTFTILSLALVLVQIMLGRDVEEQKVAERSCIGCLMRQQASVSQRAGAVLAKGGDMYADAVNWCLGSFMSRARQDDETFSQQYYDTVVAKLERIVDIVGPFSSQ